MELQKPTQSTETYEIPTTEAPASKDDQQPEIITSAPGVVPGEGFKDPNQTVREIQEQLSKRAIDGTQPVVQAGSQSGIVRKQ